MSLGLEKFDRESEINGAESAGRAAAIHDKQKGHGRKTNHTFKDEELVQAWEKGYAEGLLQAEEQKHIISTEPNEPGQIEE